MDNYNSGMAKFARAFDSFPTAGEIQPALIELGQAVEEAWQATLPWMILHCDDERLGLILGKRKRRNLIQRFLDWAVK